MQELDATRLKYDGTDANVENGNSQQRRRYGHIDDEHGATVDIPAVPGYEHADERPISEVFGSQ